LLATPLLMPLMMLYAMPPCHAMPAAVTPDYAYYIAAAITAAAAGLLMIRQCHPTTPLDGACYARWH